MQIIWDEKKDQNPGSIDLKQFEDPLALQVEWSPLCKFFTEFNATKLQSLPDGNIEVQPSLQIQTISWLFYVIGIFMMIFLPLASCNRLEEVFQISAWTQNKVIPVLIGVAFTFFGSGALKHVYKKMIFDFKSQTFAQGLRIKIPFDQIHALQVLSQLYQGSESRFFHFELNLILESGQRVHLYGHGKHLEILDDAKVLSDYLRIPIWNGIQAKHISGMTSK